MYINFLIQQFPPSPDPFPHKEGRGANAPSGSPSLLMGEGFGVGVNDLKMRIPTLVPLQKLAVVFCSIGHVRADEYRQLHRLILCQPECNFG